MGLVKNMRLKGIILVLTAGILWGVCGTVAQYLFHYAGFTPEWMVVIRLLALTEQKSEIPYEVIERETDEKE